MSSLEQKGITNLYNVIKSDDLTTFCSLLKFNNRLLKFSLGRFPLLSICYLYNSKKIIKAFEKDLIKVKDFIMLDEPFILYRDFKLKCGKAIRLYAGNSNYVMPLEIKAILGHDLFVKRSFSKFPQNELTNKNIIKIYNLKNQKCVIDNKKIKISAKKLSKIAKKTIILTNVIGFSTATVCAVILVIIANLIGFGTITYPKKIYSTSQFIKYVNCGMCISLQNNIELNKPFVCEEYDGIIYGNNKTITINYDYETSIFNNFKGSVSNLNIVNNDKNIEINQDTSLFCTTNNGTIENVNLNYEGNIEFNGSNATTFFSGLAINNYNTISNCFVQYKAKTNSTTDKDTFISAICSINYNTINNCEVKQESYIETTNTDVSSICIYNAFSKTIKNCKNYAIITQNVNSATWSPAISGIVLNNIGILENCVNYGNLFINVTIPSTKNCYVMIGGICASNNARIYHCKNVSNITSTSQNLITYAGGICGYVNVNGVANSPIIDSCVSEGTLNFSKSDETWLYCGGIAGYMIGTVNNCCGTNTFTNQYDKEKKVMSALMIGVTLYDYYFNLKNLYLNRNGNVFLQSELTTNNVGVAYLVNDLNYDNVDNENNIYGADILEDDSLIYETTEQIATCDKYW